MTSYNPFKMWGSFITAIIFVVISFYVLANKGNLPAILAFEGETTFLGKIVLAIAFPTAILGLTIEGIVPSIIYFALIFLFEFIYGFLLGWGIHSLIRKYRKIGK